ncbi:hypothetical protein [Mucilaginibacter sp.]
MKRYGVDKGVNCYNGDALGPGCMLIRLQALRAMAGICAHPYRSFLNR